MALWVHGTSREGSAALVYGGATPATMRAAINASHPRISTAIQVHSETMIWGGTEDWPVLMDSAGSLRVAFVGRRGQPQHAVSSRAQAQATFEDVARQPGRTGSARQSAGRRVVVNRQVHSTRIVQAQEAPDEADGLIEVSGEAALCVFTADCVPVLLGGPASGPWVALHAGWRGLAGGIVAQGARRISRHPIAWIGPCIGACCYEVSEAVALEIASGIGAEVIVAVPGAERPRVDLGRAVQIELRRAGVEEVRVAPVCTQCHGGWHSYRREGAGQGRNHAFVWRA